LSKIPEEEQQQLLPRIDLRCRREKAKLALPSVKGKERERGGGKARQCEIASFV